MSQSLSPKGELFRAGQSIHFIYPSTQEYASRCVQNVEEGIEKAAVIGYPVMIKVSLIIIKPPSEARGLFYI